MKICDAHLHYGDAAQMREICARSPLKLQFPCYNMVQFEAMDQCFQMLKHHGVEKSVLIPSVFREHNAREESLRCLTMAASDPEHFYPLALLDEEDPEFLEEYAEQFVGVKEHIVRHESVLTDKKRRIFDLLSSKGKLLLLHSQAPRRIEYVRSILEEFPDMKIQVAHLGRGKPGDVAFIYRVLEAFRHDETVFFDTSTVRQPEVLREAVRLVGTERILYGSDFPFFMDKEGKEDIMEQQISHVLKAGLSEHQQELIFHDNFERLIAQV